MGKKELSDEEIACRIVDLYYDEVARLGFKRELDLDAIINSYNYTLQRLKNKRKEMSELCRIVKNEETLLRKETIKEALLESGK